MGRHCKRQSRALAVKAVLSLLPGALLRLQNNRCRVKSRETTSPCCFPRRSIPTRTAYTGLWAVVRLVYVLSVQERLTLRQFGTEEKHGATYLAGQECAAVLSDIHPPRCRPSGGCSCGLPMFPRGKTSGTGNPLGCRATSRWSFFSSGSTLEGQRVWYFRWLW